MQTTSVMEVVPTDVLRVMRRAFGSLLSLGLAGIIKKSFVHGVRFLRIGAC
jgi:hypothetical protein